MHNAMTTVIKVRGRLRTSMLTRVATMVTTDLTRFGMLLPMT